MSGIFSFFAVLITLGSDIVLAKKGISVHQLLTNPNDIIDKIKDWDFEDRLSKERQKRQATETKLESGAKNTFQNIIDRLSMTQFN